MSIEKSLKKLKIIRRIFWCDFLLGLPILGVTVTSLENVVDTNILGQLGGFTVGALFVIFGLRGSLFKCPQCKMSFSSKGAYHDYSTSQCLNCGLDINTKD